MASDSSGPAANKAREAFGDSSCPVHFDNSVYLAYKQALVDFDYRRMMVDWA
jgi:hypothetical protein